MKIQQKNFKILATEIYEVKNNLGAKIMADIFHFVEKPYNLRNNSIIQRQANRTVYFGNSFIIIGIFLKSFGTLKYVTNCIQNACFSLDDAQGVTMLKMEKFLIMDLITLRVYRKQTLMILVSQHQLQMILFKNLKHLLLDLLTTTTKTLEKNLSPNQRDQVVSNLEKDEVKLKQKLVDGLTNATNEFNKALESISQSMVAVGKSTKNEITLLAIDLSGVKTLTHSAEIFLMIITVHSRK